MRGVGGCINIVVAPFSPIPVAASYRIPPTPTPSTLLLRRHRTPDPRFSAYSSSSLSSSSSNSGPIMGSTLPKDAEMMNPNPNPINDKQEDLETKKKKIDEKSLQPSSTTSTAGSSSVKTLDPPEKPLPGDCCGSGCVRCVWDVYYEELEAYNNSLNSSSSSNGQ